MKLTLIQALEPSIEALKHVPGTQLQYILETLRQLKEDLEESNLPIPEDPCEQAQDYTTMRKIIEFEVLDYNYSGGTTRFVRVLTKEEEDTQWICIPMAHIELWKSQKHRAVLTTLLEELEKCYK